MTKVLRSAVNGKEQTFGADVSRVTIGSGNDADITIDDARVEPVHVEVIRDGDQYVAERLGAPRTLFVGRRSKKMVPVSSVTVLRLGGLDGVDVVLQPMLIEHPVEPPYVAALLAQHSSITKRLRRHTLTFIAILALLAIFAYFSGSIQDFARNQRLDPVERATVRLVAYDVTGNPLWSGSGTIVDASGLILTNAHVAAPSSPGLQLQYGPRYPKVDPDYLEVWMLDAGGDAATPAYRGAVVVADGWLDLAVVRIDSDLNGEPLPKGTSFPKVSIGGRDGLNRGDTVHVLGYPGIAGGSAQRISSGSVAAWKDEDRLTDSSRDVLDTTANITGGNSGGALIDEQGDLVAVPMANRDDSSAFVSAGLARPAVYARPLIDAALQPPPAVYTSPYIEPSTGHERAQLIGWSGWQSNGNCGTPTVNPPPAALRVCAHVKVASMSPGLDLLLEIEESGSGDGPSDTSSIEAEGQNEVQFVFELTDPLAVSPALRLHIAGGQEILQLE